MQCPACREDSGDAARFCAACGAGLTAPAAGPERRKIVTVLFCDITGSTALGEAIDIESLRGVMLRYFDAMRRCLERHGGTVEKFIGDAVMGVFGVPRVREDDALRAVRAALDMRAAMAELNAALRVEVGTELEIRIGINTGEVVAAADPSSGQGLVSGDAVNVAARLQQLAAPGEILVGLPTYRLVERAVFADAVPPVPVKGKLAPLPSRRLTGLRPEPQPAVDPTALPLLGRERPLAILRLLLDTVVQDRVCHLATVFGDAGIGKSRLVQEFLRDAAEAGARVCVGRCTPYGTPALAALAEALAEVSDGNQTPGSYVLDELRRTGSSGFDADNTMHALRRLVETLAQDGPLVLAIDNLQWAHRSLLDTLEYLADAMRGVPVLLVTASRYELLDERPGWSGGKLSASCLLLAPLDRAACRDLAELLTEVRLHGGLRSAADLGEQVVTAAGGNPLFVEQLLAMRADGGADDHLPATVRVLLAARLDALEPGERALLEWVAVLGRGVDPAELAELTATSEPAVRIDDLHQLVRRRFLEPYWSGRAVAAHYRFVSQMIQDVVYRGMAKRMCAALHERVADRLLSTASDRDDLAGYHLEQAVRLRSSLGPLDAAGHTLAARAVRHLWAAGRAALAAADIGRAQDLLGRALGVAQDRAEGAHRELMLCWAETLTAAGDVAAAERVLTEVLDAADTGSHPGLVAHARLQLAVLASDRDDPDRLASVARSALVEFERAGDGLGQARAWLRLAQASQARVRLGKAVVRYERAMRHALRADARLELATILGNLAMALWLGPVPVELATDRCRQLLAQHGAHPAVRVAVECPLAALLAARGDATGARQLLAAAEHTVGELGHVYALATVPLFRGAVETAAGCLPAAEEALRRSWESFGRIGDRTMRRAAAFDLARVLLLSGRTDEARRLLDATPASGAGRIASQADQLSLRARLLAGQGEPDRACELAGRAVAAIRGADSPVLCAFVHLDHADVLHRCGRSREAATAARAARDGFAGKGHLVGRTWAEAALAAVTAGDHA